MRLGTIVAPVNGASSVCRAGWIALASAATSDRADSVPLSERITTATSSSGMLLTCCPATSVTNRLASAITFGWPASICSAAGAVSVTVT